MPGRFVGDGKVTIGEPGRALQYYKGERAVRRGGRRRTGHEPGLYKLLADALVVFHTAFVGFVLFGAAIVLRWRWTMWLHLPAVAWGIYIELSHHICPLTPLENHYRLLGGAAAYQGGFVNHYIMPVLYPRGLTHGMQVALAVVIVVLNGGAYGWLIVGRRIRKRASPAEPPVAQSALTGGEDAEPTVVAASQARNVQ